MPQIRYRIYTLSVKMLLSYAVESDGAYSFHLNQNATEKCIDHSSANEQEDNALFFQTMCVLHGDDYTTLANEICIADLSDIIFYADFSGIFDRGSEHKRSADRQKKAETMFRPEGVTLDFGTGAHRYLAFERSGNMSRNTRLSFIREDFYEPVRRRIMMDWTVGDCQLSKLYAYNGLMFSGGARIDGIGIDKPHRVIVINNQEYTVRNNKVITVEDDGSNASVRKYRRVERRENIPVIGFDGEGLISKQYAGVVSKVYGNSHTSFQIRMPYIKGMLHAVDFKDFLKTAGAETITDIWGVKHNLQDVDIILTKSMFKGFGWLTENGKSWADYWDTFRRYRHALYITGVSKEKPEDYTELNYQFLNTVSLTAEEFRPADLPSGWEHSPREDERRWLTKETELAYYNFCADEQFRQKYFLEALERKSGSPKNRAHIMARILKKNPLFIAEPVYADQLSAKAENILKQYALGRLIVSGDNRYLSGDLLEFLTLLIPANAKRNKEQSTFFSIAVTNRFSQNSFYAPGALYKHNGECTLLRNPHIARNEEIQLLGYQKVEQMRKHYLGHLSDVVMIDTHMLAAERLGGADYDGDMIKTIADPILNSCVKRNYEFSDLDNMNNIPLLKIPDVQPLIRNANDWYVRFETVRDTFSSRVGQISNAALDRSIIAYNENSDAEQRQRCREETETLAILTGLEIDSAKNGVKPDLSEYLVKNDIPRSRFLKYKSLLEKQEGYRAWYEPSFEEQFNKYFKDIDWERVDSNVERLPYLSYMLKKNTPRIKTNPAPDNELFSFAADEHWKEQLDKSILSAVSELLKTYEVCLSRIRACRAPTKNKPRKTDIERILYCRGQEDDYDADELYALFQNISQEKIFALRELIRERLWHLLDADSREAFLCEWLPEPEFAEYYDLFSDFRFGGYRILGDLICDIDDENNAADRKQLIRGKDSDAFRQMMQAYMNKPFSLNYKQATAAECRKLLDKIVRPNLAVQYMVALGKRNLLWDLLIDCIEKNVLKKGAVIDAE